jgi:gluconolactonase
MNRLLSKFLLLSTAAIFILWHLAPSTGLSQSEHVTITFGHIQRLDSRIDRLVPADATLEVLAEGFTWLEGPAWNKDGSYLLFSDIPRNAIYMWHPRKGVNLFMKPSGYTGDKPFKGREPGSNGLTFDPQGRLVLCEHGDRRITRLEQDGRKTILVDSYQGKRLNSPNDVVFKSDGSMYFTDPPFGLPETFEDPGKELDFSGVYRLSPDGELTLLLSSIKAPNGIAFSPDEKTLYLTDVDPERSAWLAYPVLDNGTLGPGKVFRDASIWRKTRAGGPDGIKVDIHGNLYGAGPEAVYVFAPDGTHIGSIFTGVPTGNLAWGDDGSSLYITADTRLLRVRLNTKGAVF